MGSTSLEFYHGRLSWEVKMGEISVRSLSEDERKEYNRTVIKELLKQFFQCKLSSFERKEYNRIVMKELFGLAITKEEERLEKKGDAELKRQYFINIIHRQLQ
jgi:hypothetical protein